MRRSTLQLLSVCVYCASSPGADRAFKTAAVAFGELLAHSGIAVVYGGGNVGLMGTLANAALAAGGEVHGVITRALVDKEIAHRELTTLQIVESMHERKAAMADAADAFVMLPGGLGTLEEFLEVVTWTQLGVHSKPCGVLNVNRFFDPFFALLDLAAQQRFIRDEHRDLVLVDSDPAALLDRLRVWVPVTIDKWIDRDSR